MSKISIVIPTYNEEGYIRRLLASIAAQTTKPHQIVIVDSFSKDKTYEDIAKFVPELPLTCVSAQRGIGLARNIGAAAATGDVLLFLDSDVELQPSFLEDAGSEFDQRQLDLASAHFYVDRESPKVDRIGAKAISLYHASFQYSKNPMGSGFCIFAKKEWHRRIKGFNEHFRHSEDHDYVKRAVENGAIFRLLKSVRFKLSNRRYVHDGRFTILSLYTKAEINRLFFNYKYAPREEALYHFGVFTKAQKKRRSAQTS
ncbi:MAG TPA: glycosyltransferase family A protein [Magnetospirillaceae bacterium]|nr:glycosyltransferase family A protein [Magnetospirillaceae bacterium]